MKISKFLSLFIFLLSTLVLLYVFYREYFFWNNELKNYYTYYKLILITLSIIFFCGFVGFIKYNILNVLIVLFLSTTFSFYSFEYYLLKKKIEFIKNFKETYGQIYEERSRLEIYLSYLTNNQEVTVSIPPSIHLTEMNNQLLFPLSGISNTLTLNCNENGYFSKYYSDRYGFNNPDSVWDNNTVEFLLIGDSFSHGACVNRPYDIASNLRELSQKNVISIGYGGNGPLIEYAALREYHLNKKIKNVLWLFTPGDLENLVLESKNIILNKYLLDEEFSQNLKENQNTVDLISKEKINLELSKQTSKINQIQIYQFLKLYNLRLELYKINFLNKSEIKKILTEDDFNPFFKILEKIHKFTNKNNSKLFFVFLPQYQDFIYEDNLNQYINEKIEKKLNEMEIPHIELKNSVFLKQENPLSLFPFELPGHYSIDGYIKVSEEIFKNIKENSNYK